MFFTTFRVALAALALCFLAACGRARLATVRPVAPARAQAETFQAISLANLVQHGHDRTYEGKLVRLEASFERYSYHQEYGRTYNGYKLWDHDQHWLLCQNIYSVVTVYPGAAPDASRDLASEPAERLLKFGTFVKLEGQFHVARSRASHGGVFEVPPSLDVYSVDGKPTHELVNI
jgi:hypothetical protein